MKIRRVEIVGFKSFIERTVFSFDAGISAILGPNGCGKSNVVDAVRWVMGEQSASNLRGQSMGDVIFAGSDSRRAHGMAEVSLIFDNSGTLEHPPVNHPLVKAYAEIMVTRRLYRSGESEYLLNKTPCRLKDITELFLDTGVGARAYSIIEQGKVASVLQSRPEERRVLIEEAAGISKYKARRKTAVRKIEAAQHNLERVDDIITEVGGRLKGLERQARETREFRALRQQMRELDIGLGLKRLQELQERNASLHQIQEQHHARVQSCETEVHQAGLELERSKLARDEADATLAQQKKQMFAWRNDLQENENASALTRQQRENHVRHRKEISAEQEQIDSRLREDRQHLSALLQQRDELQDQVKQTEHDAAQARHDLDAIMAAEQKLRVEVDSARAYQRNLGSDLTSLRQKLQNVLREQAVLQERQTHFSQESERTDAELQRLQTEKNERAEQVSASEAQVGTAQRELEDCRETMQQRKAELKSVREEREKSWRSHQRCKSRLEALREMVEGRADVKAPVQEVLQDPSMGSSFIGIVADILEVKPEYEAAVAAVLGKRLEALRLDPDADPAVVLDQLRAHRGFHRCQLEGVDPEQDWASGTPLAQAIELPSSLGGIIAGVYLVDSIEVYLGKALPAGVTLVSPAGEVLTWQGHLSLGSEDGSGETLLQNRRRIIELEQESDALRALAKKKDACFARVVELYEQAESACAEQQLVCERLQLRQQESQRAVELLERQRGELKREKETHERQQQQITQRLDSIRQELTPLQDREAALVHEVSASQSRGAEAEQQWEQIRTQVQEKQQASAEQDRANTVVAEQFKSLCNDIGHTERDITRQLERVDSLRRRQGEIDAEVITLEQREKDISSRMDVLLQKLRVSKKAVAQAQGELDECSTKLRRTEQQEREQRTQLYQARQKLESVSRELEHNREDVARQQDWLEQNYAVKSDEASEYQNSLPEDAPQRLKRLQRRIENFGEVNLLAVEEYDALRARHTFLEEQQADLLQSISDLRKAIAQINRKSRSRFKKTFAQVNEQFMQVFPRLFSGGNARLILTEPEDMLTTGIDIEARPPGKKLQNINLLSGGEKALTAVALIFAIFQIKPSPFCILDEVDAPLDHANIGRFNAMVKEMASTSQFVLITHNTRTMEIADTLYGVTMEEPGVSRLVSVDMSTYSAERENSGSLPLGGERSPEDV